MTNPVDLVRQMMEQLGVTSDDLANASTSGLPRTTVKEFMPVVRKTARESIYRTYDTYWIKMEDSLGDMALAEIKASDVAAWVEDCGRTAVQRRTGRNAVGAKENAVSAARYFFRIALNDGLVRTNVALNVAKPRRSPSPRRALTPDEVRQLTEVTSNGGNDPELDTLLVRFMLETGARRGGVLALRPIDLDPSRQSIRLREKGNTEHWQPTSLTLIQLLEQHAKSRGVTDGSAQLFRYKNGTPLTKRRFNTLTERWRVLDFVNRENISPHWLRHTAITAIERIGGKAVAQAYARHAEDSGSTTDRYSKASIAEVARAVAELTGEPHPLAD